MTILPASKPLVLSGLADEAADDLAGQLAVHRELGWPAIELRLVGGRQVSAQISDAEFAQVADAVEAAGVRVTAFASALGNWSRPINGDFAVDLAELRAALPRMQRLRVPFIRGMSWVGAGTAPEVWRDEAVRRYRELGAMAADAGITVLHENCEGWGGLSPAHAVEFHERVNSPGVGVLFDIGNTVAYGLDAWEFYRAVKPLIRHVHVKDCRRNPAGGKSSAFTMPGEGDADVRRILADLLASGYSGALAIEPHLASLIHHGAPVAAPHVRREAYLRYGHTFAGLVAELRRGDYRLSENR